MPKILYVDKNFGPPTMQVIQRANAIVEEYVQQGFILTLRQLYYQFVARDFIPNNQASYKRLGSIVNDARLAGLIDWDHITDRTRNLQSNSHWRTPGEIMVSAAESYRQDLWLGQQYRPEVWIEKDALIGVIEGICTQWDIPYFSCRGYGSQSEMWRAAMRLKQWNEMGYTPFIIHLGDHDPSGMDMTDDIFKRLRLLSGFPIHVQRIALNHDQVEEYNPPPNPAKVTDSRFEAYEKKFGDECWELDALEPQVIVKLVNDTIKHHTDMTRFNLQERYQARGKKQLRQVADKWSTIVREL